MASAAVTATCIFLLAVATHAFLLPQPALPNISRKLGLLQQQQDTTTSHVARRGRSTALSAVGLSSVPKARVGILGASGYTGAELMRILLQHPHVNIKHMTADRSAGLPFGEVFPQFSYVKGLPILSKFEDMSPEMWGKEVDVIFCCLPHATTQLVIASLPPAVKVVDLSADFRLADVKVYEKWYGGEHKAPELQKEAVYAIPEFSRDQIKQARLVANPGCYPTAAQLPLVPLLKAGLVLSEDIIIDAKSGTTGAGRSPKQNILFCEVADGISAYGIASHRHAPEIEQGLTEATGGKEVLINFTPHLMPMSRGILESIYVKLAPGKAAADLKAHLQEVYEKEPFVHILQGGKVPETRHVRGSNNCIINVFDDRVPGRAIIISAIDNLVKGASGQAVQNFNVMFGYPETTGLLSPPMFP
ncbi:hypothetical protein VYU27_002639 [Nannochloropsis oceanica]